jgi:DNA transformation protein
MMAAVRGKTSTTDSFTEFVLDQLSELGPVEARAMFGGKGLYWKDAIFGLIDDGRVYFRVAEDTRPRYEAAGTRAFEPWPGHVMKGYHEVPASVLEDREQCAGWAREAWQLPRARPKRKPAAGRKPR